MFFLSIHVTISCLFVFDGVFLMLLNEIPSPAFAVNKEGKVSVFIPELTGDAEKPEISYLFENTLFFKRTPDSGCAITGVSDEIMDYLRTTEKCLVVEIDLDKVIDLDEGKLADPAGVFKRYYEALIDKASFAEKAVDAI